MIQGFVNSQLEPVVSLTVLDVNGHPNTVSAVVDSGFNGFLTLPASLVATLGLTWQTVLRGWLADGSFVDFDIHSATVIWNGMTRRVDVQATQTTTLLGTEMLRDHSVLAHIKPGGIVEIAPLP